MEPLFDFRLQDLLLNSVVSFFQTIALIAVREGVVQLGAVHKVLPLLLSLSLTH